MAGGDQAIREPWRMALAHLLDAGVTCPAFIARIPAMHLRMAETMLRRGINSPLTSSAGRLFDAVASLAGLRDRVSHEGQAAMELEWLASSHASAPPFSFSVEEASVGSRPPLAFGPLVIDTRPLITEVVADVRTGAGSLIARRFHATMVEVVVSICGRLREASGCEAVVLSGGVFLNALLTDEVTVRLEAEGFRVYRHRLVPPGDGGLCLGQLAVAAWSY
jgi:hydrogenase maturation protein HypF